MNVEIISCLLPLILKHVNSSFFGSDHTSSECGSRVYLLLWLKEGPLFQESFEVNDCSQQNTKLFKGEMFAFRLNGCFYCALVVFRQA